MSESKIRPLLPPLVICLATVVLFFAFYLAGFLGFSLLGLAICLVATLYERRSQGEAAPPSEPFGPALDRGQRAAFWDELTQRPRPLLIAKLVGAALIALGLLGFALFSFGR